MEKSLIFFIILFVAFILLSVFLKVSLNKFNSQFNFELTKNEERIKDLFEFSYDIHFNEPPNDINIENPYECTPTDLKLCDMNDPFSCIGCKSLISTCVNFIEDVKYIDTSGVESIIPRNANANEGYCLTQRNSSQACNPYHGELVLVQTEPGSKESMLYCECMNPGYIGKTHIDGACDEVFVCDGKIDDINKPLNEINCICENGLVSQLTNNVPTCITPSVKNFTEFDNGTFYKNVYTVNKSKFTGTISNIGSFPGQEIVNPCKYCLITGKYVPNGIMVPTDEEDGWQCALKDSSQRGLPIRRDPNYRLLKGSNGPDGVIDALVSKIYIHGYIYETTFEQMTAVLKINQNTSLLQYLNVPTNNTFAFIDLKDHQLVFPGSFGKMSISKFPGVACDGIQLPGWVDDFLYDCYFVNEIPYNRRPRGHGSYDVTYSNNPTIIFDTAPKCPPKHHSILTGAAFHKWKEYENFNSSHFKTNVNGLIKYEIHQDFKKSNKVKYIFSVFDFENGTSIHYGTNDSITYNKWYASTIPKD